MAPGSSSASPCGEVKPNPLNPSSLLVGGRGSRSDQRWDFQAGLPWATLARKQSMKSRGRAGVEGGLVVADAAGDEVLHAPQVLEEASVRPGTPSRRLGKMHRGGWGGVGGVWRSSRGCASGGQGGQGRGLEGQLGSGEAESGRGLCVSGDPTGERAWAWLGGAVERRGGAR